MSVTKLGVAADFTYSGVKFFLETTPADGDPNTIQYAIIGLSGEGENGGTIEIAVSLDGDDLIELHTLIGEKINS